MHPANILLASGACPPAGRVDPMQETRTRSGNDVGGETVLDPRQSVAHPDTSPDGVAVASRPTRGTDAFETTSVMPRGAAPIAEPSGGSSSDPPTKFLRGIEQHIELPPGSLVDDLEIEQKLGEGAMGVVYKARHLKLGRQVAVKVISPSMGADPQAIGRFEREARVLATLRHPNIVDVYSFGTLPDERSYYSMEFLDGVTLYECLQHGRVPIDEALAILDQMASALEAAHAAGIVHRDLKPENTFLVRMARRQRSIVKLLDFGLSKLAVADGVEKTASGAVIGTCLYISPEQARGPDVDGRTDIYALGVVAYELILGQHPFPHALTATAALAAHLAEPPPQPRKIWPKIPPALDLLMHAMLAKDPGYRPTLAQVRAVIADVQSPTTSGSREMRAVTEHVARGPLHARGWSAAFVALALLVGIAIGASALGGTSRRGSEPLFQPAVSSGTLPIDSGEAPMAAEPPSAPNIAAPDLADTNTALTPTAEITKSRKPMLRVAAKKSAAAVTGKETPLPDAGLTQKTRAPTPEAETKAKPEVTSPPVVPTLVEKPIEHPVPPPKKPPRRDDTINPFANKRGSAAR